MYSHQPYLFNWLDDYFVPPNEQHVLQKINLALVYLNQLKDPNLVMKDHRAYNSLIFLSSINSDIYYAQLITYNQIAAIFSNICFYYQEKLRLFLKGTMPEDQSYEFDFFSAVLNLLHLITDRSKSFSDAFMLNRGVNSLINYLDDDSLVKRLLDFNRKDDKRKVDTRLTGLDLLSVILGSLVNISSISENAKVEFNVINVYNVMSKLLKQIKSHEALRILVVMNVVNIANDEQISKTLLIKTVAEDVSKIIKIAAKSLSENLHVKRTKTFIENEDDIEIFGEVCFIFHKNWNWNIAKLFMTLTRLAINDEMKYDLYETFNMKEILEKIIFYGNETEKLYATKLLWQLCFDGAVAKKVKGDFNLFQPILNMTKQVSLKNNALKKYCEGNGT
jgi:hypothetical protein